MGINSYSMTDIYWDAYGLDERGSGVRSAAVHLSDALAVRGVRPTLIGTDETSDAWPDSNVLKFSLPRGKLRRIAASKPIYPQLAYNRLRSHLRGTGASAILHGLANINSPILRRSGDGIRTVVSVYDIIPLLAPDAVSRFFQLECRWLFGRIFQHVDHVVCSSQWTIDTIAERFPAVIPRMVLIRLGVDHLESATGTSSPPVEQGEFMQLLSVSRYEAYKRHDLLFDILRLAGPQVHLTLVTNALGVRNANANAADLIGSGRLSVLTGLEQSRLLALFHECDVYLQPSLYEGYCLPAAEALNAGRPVVYCAGSATTELVEGMGAQLPPTATAGAWLESVLSVSNWRTEDWFTQALQVHRRQLPTWSAAAQQTIALYQDTLPAARP